MRLTHGIHLHPWRLARKNRSRHFFRSFCCITEMGHILRVCTPFPALNTQHPGATLTLLRLGAGLGLLPKRFIASQSTWFGPYKLFLPGTLFLQVLDEARS